MRKKPAASKHQPKKPRAKAAPRSKALTPRPRRRGPASPFDRLVNSIGIEDYLAFLSVQGAIESIQRNLKKPIQNSLSASFTAWRNTDAAKMQAIMGDLIEVPGAQDDPSGCTFVIAFPLRSAIRALQDLSDAVEASRQKKIRGGKTRGKDISASIGKKFHLVRSAARLMQQSGTGKSRIVEELARGFNLSERHIQRILSHKPANDDPDYVHPDDYELMGLTPEKYGVSSRQA